MQKRKRSYSYCSQGQHGAVSGVLLDVSAIQVYNTLATSHLRGLLDEVNNSLMTSHLFIVFELVFPQVVVIVVQVSSLSLAVRILVLTSQLLDAFKLRVHRRHRRRIIRRCHVARQRPMLVVTILIHAMCRSVRSIAVSIHSSVQITQYHLRFTGRVQGNSGWASQIIQLTLLHIKLIYDDSTESHHNWCHYRPHSRGDNTFGNVRVCICPFVCGSSPVWTVWPLTLIFGTRVDVDLG